MANQDYPITALYRGALVRVCRDHVGKVIEFEDDGRVTVRMLRDGYVTRCERDDLELVK